MSSLLEKAKKLPDTPGIYLFCGGKKILYIGKATSLRSRVKSYFARDLGGTRGPLLVEMIRKTDNVSFKKTDSVLEALLLEAEMIKKYQPPYNTEQKDDKSFNCIVITDEKFPRVLLIRKREVDLMFHASSFMVHSWYGPFPNSSQLKTALKIIRKIFPFRDKCTPHISPFPPLIKEVGESARPEDLNPSFEDGVLPLRKGESRMYSSPCFSRQIGLCPGVCTGEITEKEYQKTIRHLRLFFEGKKKKLLATLTHDMNTEAKAKRFEKASEIKKTIFALRHIQDIALLNRGNDFVSVQCSSSASVPRPFRIEAYDLSHFGGKEIVGAMSVVENGIARPSEYRLFKLQSIMQPHEVKGLQEILSRRFSHAEWKFPQIIVVDGNDVERRATEEILKSLHLPIPIVAVTKDEKHKPKAVFPNTAEMEVRKKEILLANSEAHRFALKFQRKRRFL